MKYKTGICTIKLDHNGAWLKKDSINYAKTIKHVYVSYIIDENNRYVSFFTSKLNLKTSNGIVSNIKCNSAYFKFINQPLIFQNKVLDEYMELECSIEAIENVLKIKINTDNALNKLSKDMILNFKYSLNIDYNEKIEKILTYKIKDDIIELKIETVTTVYIIDEGNNIYNTKTIELAWNNDINTDFFLNNNLDLFNTRYDALEEGSISISKCLINGII